MAFGIRVAYEALRNVAFGGISGTYAAIGTPTAGNVRLYSLKNDTNEDLIISMDGTTDHIFMGANSFMIVDLSANKVRDDGLFIAQGTQFYVKEATSTPSSGALYMEILVAEGGN